MRKNLGSSETMAPRTNPGADWAIVKKFARSAGELFALIRVIQFLSMKNIDKRLIISLSKIFDQLYRTHPECLASRYIGISLLYYRTLLTFRSFKFVINDAFNFLFNFLLYMISYVILNAIYAIICIYNASIKIYFYWLEEHSRLAQQSSKRVKFRLCVKDWRCIQFLLSNYCIRTTICLGQPLVQVLHIYLV